MKFCTIHRSLPSWRFHWRNEVDKNKNIFQWQWRCLSTICLVRPYLVLPHSVDSVFPFASNISILSWQTVHSAADEDTQCKINSWKTKAKCSLPEPPIFLEITTYMTNLWEVLRKRLSHLLGFSNYCLNNGVTVSSPSSFSALTCTCASSCLEKKQEVHGKPIAGHQLHFYFSLLLFIPANQATRWARTS